MKQANMHKQLHREDQAGTADLVSRRSIQVSELPSRQAFMLQGSPVLCFWSPVAKLPDCAASQTPY